MLNKEQIIEAVKSGRNSECLDGRDYARLASFFTADELPMLGMKLADGATHEAKPMTREAVIDQLESDLSFAFEKALNQRGLSASCMYEVVKMWMWVLEDDLQNDDDYAQYGLPLLKKVAVKYDMPNPIGDDYGDEDHYASE